MSDRKTMLIVDDMEANRAMLAAAFSAEYEILTASDGAEAMNVVQKCANRITIILLDIIMPKIDGIAFLKWISASTFSGIPVIAVTSDESYQLDALENGAWDFIAKPTNNKVIRARINNVLGRYAWEGEQKQNTVIKKAKLEMDNLVNSIPGGIAIYKVTDHFETIFFSDGVAELSGYTREEYARWAQGDASVTVYEEDKNRLLQAAMENIKSGKPIDETYRIYHKNGGLVWVRLNGVLIGEEDGAYIMHAVFQKPSRMAQLYDNIVNESQNIIYVSDLNNYDLLYMNHTGLKTIKKDVSDYSAKKCYEFLFGRSEPCEFCKIDQMNSESYFEREFVYPQNGETYSMRGKLLDWNGIAAHVEYVQNVTSRRKAERQNAALTQQLQSVMENIPGGMCVYRIDKNGYHPVVHNQAFFDIFGYSPEHQQEVLQKTNFLNVHPDDLQELQQAVGKAVKQAGRINVTYRVFNDRKGRYIWMNLNGVVVAQPDGEKLCYISYTDVTSEREMQERLIQTQSVLEDLREKAQNALDSYQSLVNAVPGGIAQYEVCGGSVLTRYFSDGICELTGCTREEREKLCNQNVLLITYEEDTPALTAAIEKAVKNRENINYTYRINTKSGNVKWVHLSAAYSAGPNGENLYQAVFTDVDKLKRIEQELQDNQLRYEVAIKSSGINIWEYDIQKDSLYVISNSARIKQNCFHIDHYIQSTLENGYVREDSVERFLSIFERLRSGQKDVTEDIWYKTTDEAGWWCERVSYTATFDPMGNPLKAFGAGRDVTREKEAEKKFQEEISFRKAIQSDNLASAMLDLTNNRVLEINSDFASVQELRDKTADAYFAKTAQKVVGKQRHAEFCRQFNTKVLLNRFGSGEFVVSTELTRLYDTEQIYWVNYSVHLIQNLETKNVIAHISGVDITQEKVMQTIMDTVSKTDYDFFVVVDCNVDSAQDYAVKSGKHLFCSEDSFEQSMERLIRAEVCPEDLDRVLSECKIENAWERVKDGKTHKFNFSIRMPDGTVRRKQLQITAISVERKTFLMSRIDVNSIYKEQEAAKEKLQTALLEAERANHVKMDFLSRMSHDIRTPMNAVISLAALGKDSETLEEAADYFQKIDVSGQYLLDIINNVLDLDKIEAQGLQLHPEVVCLPQFIGDTLSIVLPTATKKQIQLEVKQSGIQSKYMRMDVTCVRQVVVNLLSNAIKFTPNGGKVELLLENISYEGRFVKNRMVVKDTGIGISSEFMPKIFSPFEQEETQNDISRQGTGLGLAIVKSIVEKMNGTIWAESEKNKGSTFYVEWALETASQEEYEQKQTPKKPVKQHSLAGKRILLAEDHPLNAEIAKKLLEKKEILVDHVPNGRLAVEQFAAMKPNYYDGILMDIRMPVLNGIEAAKEIRAFDRADAKDIPIIAMTANAFDEDVNTSLEAGMNAHLAKPVDPQKLYDTLSELL